MFCESHLEAAVLLCGISNLPATGAVGNSHTDSPVCFDAVNVLKELKIKAAAMTVKQQERRNTIRAIKYIELIKCLQHLDKEVSCNAPTP